MPEVGDKAPLDAYLAAIANDLTSAVDQVETAHPNWRVGSLDVTVRAALRPELAKDGITLVRVWADVDISRSEQVSEINLPLSRKPL